MAGEENLTPEQAENLRQMQAMATEQMAQGLADLIRALNPVVDAELALRAARDSVALHASGELSGALDDAVAGAEARTTHELWSFGVVSLKNRKKLLANVVVRKDLEEVAKHPEELIGYLMVLGALTNPHIRAILLAHGYEMSIAQLKGSRIIT